MTSTNTIVVWTDPQPGHAHKPHAVYWARSGLILGPNYFDDQRLLEFPLTGEPLEWVKQKFAQEPNAHIKFCERDVGQFHPRFYQGGYYLRDVSLFEAYSGAEHNAAASSAEQIDILIEDLTKVCRVAAPDNATDGVYGSEIRNILILACTEVEAQLRGILKINGYSVKDDQLNMGHYARVAGPMKLDRYGAKLNSYRDYAEIKPFEGWASGKRLPWYQSYNSTKHDREGKFDVATLAHAINAVAALEILLFAEYGPGIERASRFFTVVNRPTWEPPQYTHAHPVTPDTWTPVNFDFA
jgi:hypothetical protein